ncbi:MAG: DUF4870 domain-containing protein [Capsulimonas sp.]|uniref:DUF4870 domain-containing protein n=1 Tax=Capsulimonas sp. TaxID=2494211 RepID=UPI003263CB43
MNDQPTDLITSEDRTSAMLAYLLGFVTKWIAPLIIYLVKKGKSEFAEYHALQALFFQIAIMCLYAITAAIFAPLMSVVFVIDIVFCILAGLAANRGEWYEIPVIGEFARKQIKQ